MAPNKIFMLFLIIGGIISSNSESSFSPRWMWDCENGKCKRIMKETKKFDCGLPLRSPYPNLPVCRLACGHYGALWPKPTNLTTIEKGLLHVNTNEIFYNVKNSSKEALDYLGEVVSIFKKNVRKECGEDCLNTGAGLLINITIQSSSSELNWGTNEGYNLTVCPGDPDGVLAADIFATTVFGVRHALESLTQLSATIKCGNSSVVVMSSNAKIVDKPNYQHRGLLIDTARNYLKVETIKRQIDAMASCKMNVLHWHATDSQSFPLVSPRVPQLSRYGAYSPDKTYTGEDVKELLRYAKLRGIRIIMEIDTPAHAENGWQWGPTEGLGNLVLCANKAQWWKICSDPPCGQLNPTNENIYEVLGRLYNDIIDWFPKGEVFHMGGDEVFMQCWNSTPEVRQFLIEKQMHSNWGLFELWGYFQARALKMFDEKVGNSDTPIIMWSSELTQPSMISKYLPSSRYVIQTWVSSQDQLPIKLLDLKYRIIVSSHDIWYLDQTLSFQNYQSWKNIYDNILHRHPNVLGGEVCSWGEEVDDQSIDSRVWPRTAAAAERLWSNPEYFSVDAVLRFHRHRERLVEKGIQAEAVSPRWCIDNEGACHNYFKFGEGFKYVSPSDEQMSSGDQY